MPDKLPNSYFQRTGVYLCIFVVLALSHAVLADGISDEISIGTAIQRWCEESGYAYSQLSADGVCEFNEHGAPIPSAAGGSSRSVNDIKGEAWVMDRSPTGKELLALSPKRAINGHPTRHYEWFAPGGSVGIGVEWQRGGRIIKVQAGMYGFDEVPAEFASVLHARATNTALAIDELIDFSKPVMSCQAPVDRYAELDRTLAYIARLLQGAIQQPDPSHQPFCSHPDSQAPGRKQPLGGAKAHCRCCGSGTTWRGIYPPVCSNRRIWA